MADTTGRPPEGDGHVGRVLSESKPSWPDHRDAPLGAPNVVVVLCDDLGFSDLACYGSEIETPATDALAAAGVRYVNHHVTPLCSPTRAALLTGVNHHRAGVGTVAVEDHGFPGYRSRIVDDVATAAEVFRHNGYATYAVGKWHLSPHSSMSNAGDKRSWPVQRGFDRYYGFLEAFTNLHHPHALYHDNHLVMTDAYADGYFLTDDLTDQSISLIRNLRAAGSRPFFLYLAHGAGHAPHQAKPADIEKYRGRYDAGWDEVRAHRYRRQVELGLVPGDVRLPDPVSDPGYAVPRWADLTRDERALCARYMEVYAGMIDNVDQNLGRLLTALDEPGELDDTIVIFTSDNGAAMGGGRLGTSEYMHASGSRSRRPSKPFDHERVRHRDYARIPEMGGPRTFPHYPLAWAMVGNTPFRYYKGTTFAGGQQVPMIVSWPRRVHEGGAVRRQYTHVTDVLPTLVDVLGLGLPPARDAAGGPAPMTGVSFGMTLTHPGAASGHTDQYSEMRGQRGYRRGDWEIVTLHRKGDDYGDHEWRLYDRRTDPTQIDDLAASARSRVDELARAWDLAARENHVFPMVDGELGLAPLRPSPWTTDRGPVTLTPDHETLDPWVARELIQERDYAVRIRFEYRAGDQGILVAHGDQAGGYALYVEGGELFYVLNAFGPTTTLTVPGLGVGTVEVHLDVHALDAETWELSASVGGGEAVEATGLEMWNPYTPFEGVDVGIDRRSPVDWGLYERHGAFPYSGPITSVTYAPGPYVEGAAATRLERVRQMSLRVD